MTQRVPIEGRVARVLNLRELAINRGDSHGVREGMIFDVLDPKAEDITDPETGEVLGSVYRPKVQVRVFSVEERLSLARTFKSTRVNLGGTGLGGLAKAFEAPKWEERHETLKTNESTWQDLDESESIVKTGDPVVEAVVLEGSAETAGSRTLDYPEAARELERAFSEWLVAGGWTVKEQTASTDQRIDVVASRDDELLLAEAKAKRGALGAADLAQAIGWLSLYPQATGKPAQRALVVGPAGLTADAQNLLQSYRDSLLVFQSDGEGGFARLDEAPRELEATEAPDSERA
jgi:hypothetical protein